MASQQQIALSPFLRKSGDHRQMMGPVLVALALLALLFTFRYDSTYFARFSISIFAGITLEMFLNFLKEVRLSPPRASSAVTSALLVLSVPAYMPLWQVFVGIFIAILFGKVLSDKEGLRLNPMLLGRLSLMFLFPDTIQEWQNPHIEIDALTSATPLGLYVSEGASLGLPQLLFGSIQGLWEGFVALVPGSPGDVMPLLTLLFGTVLYFMGIIDWRPAGSFILSFGITAHFLGMPALFSILSGSILFTAVFIITDPRTTPASKSGRLIAGSIAGILNALIRNVGYYPEGVVIAILTINFLSPLFDTLAFQLRGKQLLKKQTIVH